MYLFNQNNIWPIARFYNYKFGLLFASIITMFSILGFLYLNGHQINTSSKVIVAISQNDIEKDINNIVQILQNNKVHYGYKLIPETEISELLIGLDNTKSISKYLSNKNNYAFPAFIEFNYKTYYKFNIDHLLKDITFNKYIIDHNINFINILIYITYFIFLLIVLSLSNLYFLQRDKKPIKAMCYYGAKKNLLMSLLLRRIFSNALLGSILGWLIVFIIINILNLTNEISINTTHFINLKNINSFCYFLSLLIIILFSQYIVVVKILKKYMSTKIE